MNVHVLDGLGRSIVLPATRVLVTADGGTPVALVVQLAPSVIEATCIDDADFNLRLRIHGIDRTVQLDALMPPRVADFDLRGGR